MAQGLVEAGGKVHCLDRAPRPDKGFEEVRAHIKEQRHTGALRYHQVDVTQDQQLEECIAGIAAENQRLDGLIAGTCLCSSSFKLALRPEVTQSTADRTFLFLVC
jgi:D-arabinitol 2-dehydrogenase